MQKERQRNRGEVGIMPDLEIEPELDKLYFEN